MNELVQKWLNLVCQMIPKVSSAVVVRHEGSDAVAVWPDNQADQAALLAVIELSKQQNAPVLIDKSDRKELLIAHPLRVGRGTVDGPVASARGEFGVLALILEAGANEKQVVNRLLDWGSSWLELLLERESLATEVGADSNFQNAGCTDCDSTEQLGMVGLMVQLLDLDADSRNTTILVSMIADYFSAQRVYLANYQRGRVTLDAISNEVAFDSQVNIVSLVEAAMEEAVNQSESVHVQQGDPRHLIAHEMLLGEVDADACSTILLRSGSSVTGVMLIEWGAAASKNGIEKSLASESTEVFGSLLGALLTLRQQSQLGIMGRLKKSVVGITGQLIGPDWVMPKLLTLVLFGVLSFACLVDGTYEVSAAATLEGKAQQAIVAPYKGFIASAEARAGDTVVAGEVLGRMEDKDLLLEIQQVESEKESLNRQYRQALSDLNQSEARILRAKLAQVEAREELLAYQYQRVALTTPIDGVVLTGDLSRSKGAPVEQGQLLFEIAPLQSYTIVLMVEESDISDIKPGLSGEVLLTSHPDIEIPFVIEHISNVLVSAETNGVVFRTEGIVQGDFDVLRPGMEGLARVNIEQRSYAWIWFHRLADWWRIKLWQYLP